MGTLLTLHLPPGSPVAELPWVITIGALGDEEDWEPVVCGPYERAHALALARAVVADEDLMAVVEPLLPLAGADAIRAEIELARAAAEGRAEDDEAPPDGHDQAVGAAPTDPDAGHRQPTEAEVRAGWSRIAGRLTR